MTDEMRVPLEIALTTDPNHPLDVRIVAAELLVKIVILLEQIADRLEKLLCIHPENRVQRHA